MRVTAETKELTRQRIEESASKLFCARGFDATTTRDIAAEASIAVGTLFNYFPSKEALGMSLVASALDAARDDFNRGQRGDESLEELLFAHIMTGLRRLDAYRGSTGAIVEAGLSPFTEVNSGEGQRVRAEHLETVADLIMREGRGGAPSLVVMHLYWTLYLGVLAFWSRDESPHQEDTLVVLDQSLRLFVSSLNGDGPPKEV